MTQVSDLTKSSIWALWFALAGDGLVIVLRLLNLLEDLGFIIGTPSASRVLTRRRL